jgi:5'-nucleotidase
MNILLTNESGCFRPGIIALAKTLCKNHRVVIVAPLNPQINCGHAFTHDIPLRVQQFFELNKVKIFSVSGTPCDCVTLALDKILHSKPDLIISGIRDRQSRGEFCYSSGVVSAAIEGTIQGIKSISVSAKIIDKNDEREFMRVAKSISKNLNYLVKNMPAGATLNINYPEKFKSKNVVVTQLTTEMSNCDYRYEVNPFGKVFYWLDSPATGYAMSALEQKGDLYWLKKGYLTITPLKLNMTDESSIQIVENGGIKI